MKAAVCTGYGPPEVLQIKDIEKPVPADNEVLIRVYATTCHVGDVRIRSFNVPFWQKIPFRLYLGLTKPKRSVLGMELAGEIESAGKDVKRFKPSDRVFAFTGFNFGSYAEYKCMPEKTEVGDGEKKGLVALKPTNLTYEEAAAVPGGGLTALLYCRKSNIRNGQEVLVNGASGSVGTYAVQLARYFGAEVTGVCGKANLELVKRLGADTVIDYTREDFTRNNREYDVIIDATYKPSFSQCRGSLKKNGIYVSQKSSIEKLKTEDLIFLKEIIEAGKLKAVIDRRYPLEQIVEAHRYVETGHKKGNVILTIGPDDKFQS